MSNNRLFNEYGATNELGKEIENKIDSFLEDLILDYVDYQGADVNDMQSLTSNVTGALYAEARLRYATRLRKQKSAKLPIDKPNDL